MHGLEMERFAVQFWYLPLTLKFPREHCCMVFVVAECLAIGCLVFLAKMRSGRFVALKRVQTHQLGEFEEIGDASGTFEDWLKSSSLPGTRTSRQNCSLSSGIFSSASRNPFS